MEDWVSRNRLPVIKLTSRHAVRAKVYCAGHGLLGGAGTCTLYIIWTLLLSIVTVVWPGRIVEVTSITADRGHVLVPVDHRVASRDLQPTTGQSAMTRPELTTLHMLPRL